MQKVALILRRIKTLEQLVFAGDIVESDTCIVTCRNFFRAQRGAAGTFRFTDPWDATKYANCSLEGDEMIESFVDIGRGKTTLVVKENRS